ncbi:MAG: response regulator [Candidatus Saccharimonadales bacterium]|jgi:DNA-binding response OmpR family regulator
MNKTFKVAIVEDEPAIAHMYRLKFEAEGYKVELAEDGEVGLKLCEDMSPDIVLLDIMMPVMDGTEMLTKMRATQWGKDIKVLILTNRGKEEAPEELNNLDIYSYIVKAEMTPRQVFAKVQEALGVSIEV